MARPKNKTSHARKTKRRAHNALKAPNYIACPNCGEFTMPHQVCGACGHYKGREVISEAVEE
ncbi:MAG: 50S ribosomal protein L32 [Deltaproteobacteria bacterium]|nr:50S ribosomal protein L32 [Deltaproteobacteria bacterium]MCB9478933.1 50S ribosomal protein L32 [Deltaproteobacteria bacterium]MCB9489437.1 50S ribosomal protein L32 [Deltaproteobacteria bacterium]